VEGNQEELRGKLIVLYKEVKEEVFVDGEHLTVKKILGENRKHGEGIGGNASTSGMRRMKKQLMGYWSGNDLSSGEEGPEYAPFPPPPPPPTSHRLIPINKNRLHSLLRQCLLGRRLSLIREACLL